MSRFATDASRLPGKSKTTVNLAGGEAYQESPKLELVSMLLTSFVQDQYYRSGEDGLARLRELLNEVDPVFAAKAAIYARNEFGMRTISHVVAGELAGRVKGAQWTKRFYDYVVRRPDDMTEILAYYLIQNGKPIPNSLKKGLASAFSKFDGYQLAKYRGENRAFSLVDVVNLVHPVPTEKNAQALKMLVKDTLRSTETFEAKLSAAGKSENVGEAKAEAWADLLRERKIGYFALLKNLRNIQDQAPDLIPLACELLTDRKLVKNSLVLPFRYLTALEQISDTRIVSALSKAIDVAIDNVPKLDGRNLVVIDHSGSMGGYYGYGNASEPVSWGSLQAKGDVFAAAVFKANATDVMVFGTDAGYVRGLNTDDSTLSIARQIYRQSPPGGHGTNFQAIFNRMEWAYDRIFIFSDMQAWIGYYSPQKQVKDYCRTYKAQPYIYSFDLAGYGTLQFPEDRVVALAGFSEKVFDLVKVVEQDRKALVNTIEKVQL